jgi:hypothetical protein
VTVSFTASNVGVLDVFTIAGWPSASSPTEVDSAAPMREPPAYAFAPTLFHAMRPAVIAGVITS